MQKTRQSASNEISKIPHKQVGSNDSQKSGYCFPRKIKLSDYCHQWKTIQLFSLLLKILILSYAPQYLHFISTLKNHKFCDSLSILNFLLYGGRRDCGE